MSSIELTSEELASRLGGRLDGNGDVRITGVNALADAGAEEITFLADERHARRWSSARAGCAVVTAGLPANGHDRTTRALIVVDDAQLAVAALLEIFQAPEPTPDEGIHGTAVVHETAQLGPAVRIGPHVSIDRGCRVGAGCVLHAGVRLYRDVELGSECVLHANTVVRHACRIGDRVITHQNVSIGADGFGYRPGPRGLVKMPHLGIVQIGDDVEIGAGTCIDRGKFGATRIDAGTKIDNSVHIGHNCRIGRRCVIAAQCGLAGSVTLEDGVVLGGQVGIAEGLTIGTGAQVGAKSGLLKDIPPGERWLGYPGAPGSETLRQWAALRKLPGLLGAIGKRPEAAPPTARRDIGAAESASE